MKKTTLYHFAKLDQTKKHLMTLDGLTPGKLEDLTQKARETFNAQNITAAHGSLNFDRESAFISSPDSINGFFFPSADFRDKKTGFRLVCISFELKKHYDFANHRPGADTVEAVAIYEDSNEDLYFPIIDKIPGAPLEKWQQELKRRISEAQEHITAWQKVKRLKKKNGEDFASIQKNFEGVTISQSWDGFRVDLHFWTSESGYISDIIYNFKGEAIKTICDIEKAISDRIIYLTEYAAQNLEILKKSEQIYSETMRVLIETVNKYATPNATGVVLPYFRYQVEEFLKGII